MIFYSRKSPRAKRYDYSFWWMYFTTICTKCRECYFWKIKNGEMILSEIGKICEEELQKMLNKRSDVDMHNYVIMPNHVHLLFYKWEKSHSLWSVIWWWKSAVTKKCHENWFIFGWQTSYHDTIVRDENAYNTITYYIDENPQNRGKDKFYV